MLAMKFERDAISCNWDNFQSFLLQNWNRLRETDLQRAGRSRRSIARVIQQKYGIASELVEHYLRNIERILPL